MNILPTKEIGTNTPIQSFTQIETQTREEDFYLNTIEGVQVAIQSKYILLYMCVFSSLLFAL